MQGFGERQRPKPVISDVFYEGTGYTEKKGSRSPVPIFGALDSCQGFRSALDNCRRGCFLDCAEGGTKDDRTVSPPLGLASLAPPTAAPLAPNRWVRAGGGSRMIELQKCNTKA
jgi:hypothetical protein